MVDETKEVDSQSAPVVTDPVEPQDDSLPQPTEESPAEEIDLTATLEERNEQIERLTRELDRRTRAYDDLKGRQQQTATARRERLRKERTDPDEWMAILRDPARLEEHVRDIQEEQLEERIERPAKQREEQERAATMQTVIAEATRTFGGDQGKVVQFLTDNGMMVVAGQVVRNPFIGMDNEQILKSARRQLRGINPRTPSSSASGSKTRTRLPDGAPSGAATGDKEKSPDFLDMIEEAAKAV